MALVLLVPAITPLDQLQQLFRSTNFQVRHPPEIFDITGDEIIGSALECHGILQSIFVIADRQCIGFLDGCAIHWGDGEIYGYFVQKRFDSRDIMGFSANVVDIVDGNGRDDPLNQAVFTQLVHQGGMVREGLSVQQNIDEDIGIDEEFHRYFFWRYASLLAL